MKLIKCKKCGATVMTTDTLLSSMQDEFNTIMKKAHRAKGAEKQLIVQQLSHLKKMMTAVCHSSTEAEVRKSTTYNELTLLKKHLIANSLIDLDLLDKFQTEARELTKKKMAEDEKKVADLYSDFENLFYNNTKSDPTATKALKGGVSE